MPWTFPSTPGIYVAPSFVNDPGVAGLGSGLGIGSGRGRGVSGDWQPSWNETANCTSGVCMGAWLLTTTTKNQKEWRRQAENNFCLCRDARKLSQVLVTEGHGDGVTFLKFRPVGQAGGCSGGSWSPPPGRGAPVQVPSAHEPGSLQPGFLCPHKWKASFPSALVTSLDSACLNYFAHWNIFPKWAAAFRQPSMKLSEVIQYKWNEPDFPFFWSKQNSFEVQLFDRKWLL